MKRQHRRDFIALYKCEHCGHEVESSGYDDDYYHTKVIPQIKCDNCGKSAGDDYEPRTPRYRADEVV